jgi:heat shock protein HtpX
MLLGVLPLVVSLRIYPTLSLKFYGARTLAPQEAPRLFAIVAELAGRAVLDHPPRLAYIRSSAALVFSTGRGERATVAVSDGILRLLNLRELVGVMGHEVSHIANGDTLVMSLADVTSRLTSTLSLLGQFLILLNLPLYFFGGHPLPWLPLLLMLVAPTASALLQLALSRTREYEADLEAARLTGDPAALADALAKLENHQRGLLRRQRLPFHPGSEPSLLRTHPQTEERIRRLREYDEELHPERPELFRAEDHLRFPPPHLERAERRPRRHLGGLWY